MAKTERVLDESLWARAYERIQRLPPERQAEIVDYIDFLVEREEAEDWDLSEDELASIARHRDGDHSDTVPLRDVEQAILEGRADEV